MVPRTRRLFRTHGVAGNEGTRPCSSTSREIKARVPLSVPLQGEAAQHVKSRAGRGAGVLREKGNSGSRHHAGCGPGEFAVAQITNGAGIKQSKKMASATPARM